MYKSKENSSNAMKMYNKTRSEMAKSCSAHLQTDSTKNLSHLFTDWLKLKKRNANGRSCFMCTNILVNRLLYFTPTFTDVCR